MHQHGLEQVAALAVLHDDVHALSVLKGAVEFGNIWSIKHLHRCNLSMQLMDVLWVHLLLVICLDDDFEAGG